MKLLILMLFSMLSFNVFSGSCTNVTRTDYLTQEILTSADLNADFNQLVTGHNSFDLGCGTSSTLEVDALNQGSGVGFDAMLNGVKEGCGITILTATSLYVDPCRIAVDKNLITSTSSVTVGWSDYSGSEAAASLYYLYAKTGTSLDIEISTSTPNALGFNGTSRILGKFYNDATGDIATYSIFEWHIDGFKGEKQASIPVLEGSSNPVWTQCPFYFDETPALRNMGTDCVKSISSLGTGQRKIVFKSNTFKDLPICTGLVEGAEGYQLDIAASDSNYEFIDVNIRTSSTSILISKPVYMNCVGVGYP